MLEWWELYDENHKLPYFYNTKTGETEWVRPSLGVVIPVKQGTPKFGQHYSLNPSLTHSQSFPPLLPPYSSYSSSSVSISIQLVAIQNSKIGKRVSMSIKRASIIHSFDSPNASSIPSYALGGSTDILGRGSSTDLLGRGSSNDLMLKSSNPDLQSVEGPNYTYQQGSPKVPLGIKTSDQHQLAKELDSLDMQSPIKDSVMQQHHSFRDSSALATKSSSSPKVPHHMYPENHDQQFMQQPRISSANVADSSPSGSGAPPPPPPPPPPPVPTLGSNGKFYSIGDPVNNPGSI